MPVVRGAESADVGKERFKMLIRSRARDLVFILLGILVLVMKRQLAQLGGVTVRDYGGNIAASFAAFFLLKLPAIPSGFRLAIAAASSLLVTELFEATSGFGFMSNTYDPGDYLANAIGVGLALGVEAIMLLVSRPRASVTGNV
jgi:hypothetical protein